MVFATATLARRIELAEATMIGEFGRLAAAQFGPERVSISSIAGGIAVAAGAGAPYSKIAGLGFEPIDESSLAAVEQQFAGRDTPVRVELATLGDPETGALMTRRGYVLQGFENVLAISLPASERETGGTAVSTIADSETARWVDVLGTSFAAPDVYDGPIVEEQIDRALLDALLKRTSEIDGFMPYLARREGEIAGAAGMRITNGVAQLCGAGTLPAHRRRGVQTALLRHRLADAARAGCDIAVVTTQPGSVSQQNVQRQGFELLYARAILVRPVPFST